MSSTAHATTTPRHPSAHATHDGGTHLASGSGASPTTTAPRGSDYATQQASLAPGASGYAVQLKALEPGANAVQKKDDGPPEITSKTALSNPNAQTSATGAVSSKGAAGTVAKELLPKSAERKIPIYGVPGAGGVWVSIKPSLQIVGGAGGAWAGDDKGQMALSGGVTGSVAVNVKAGLDGANAYGGGTLALSVPAVSITRSPDGTWSIGALAGALTGKFQLGLEFKAELTDYLSFGKTFEWSPGGTAELMTFQAASWTEGKGVSGLDISLGKDLQPLVDKIAWVIDQLYAAWDAVQELAYDGIAGVGEMVGVEDPRAVRQRAAQHSVQHNKASRKAGEVERAWINIGAGKVRAFNIAKCIKYGELSMISSTWATQQGIEEEGARAGIKAMMARAEEVEQTLRDAGVTDASVIERCKTLAREAETFPGYYVNRNDGGQPKIDRHDGRKKALDHRATAALETALAEARR